LMENLRQAITDGRLNDFAMAHEAAAEVGDIELL